MQAAGICCSQRLGDLIAQLPATEPELIARLGGQPSAHSSRAWRRSSTPPALS